MATGRWHGHILADQILEVEPNLGEHARMCLSSVHTLRPDQTALLCTAELACQYQVECFHLFLGPSHTSAHHGRREAALEAAHRVSDDRKVDERQLPDVEMEITLEDALPMYC